MKVYVLVDNDKDGNPTFDMSVTFGRHIRAYNSKARARTYARKFQCSVVELDIADGKVVANEKDPTYKPAL